MYDAGEKNIDFHFGDHHKSFTGSRNHFSCAAKNTSPGRKNLFAADQNRFQ
jgi:hypothetical protein